jgi:hypothetical protein
MGRGVRGGSFGRGGRVMDGRMMRLLEVCFSFGVMNFLRDIEGNRARRICNQR